MSLERNIYSKDTDPQIIRHYQHYGPDPQPVYSPLDSKKNNRNVFASLLRTIYFGPHVETSRIFQSMTVGALLGLAHGLFLLCNRYGVRKFQHARIFFNSKSVIKQTMLSKGLEGMLFGAGWYLFDSVMQSGYKGHGAYRYILSHSLYAGLLGIYFVNPTFFPYGFLMGAIFGTIRYTHNNRPSYPGFFVRLSKVSDDQFDKENFEFTLQSIGKKHELENSTYYIIQNKQNKLLPRI